MPLDGHTGDDALQDYLLRLRRRARLRALLSGGLLAAAALTLALVVVTANLGPVVSPGVAMACWAACLLAPAAVLAGLIWRRRRLDGAAAATLLRRHAPELALPLRSAVELAGNVRSNQSDELVHAHVSSVEARLAKVPPALALPWSDLRRPSLGLALGVCLVGAFALQSHPALHGGLLAMRRPAQVADDGMLAAPIARDLQARLVYPSYLRKPPEPVPDPDRIEAPVGSTLELSLSARLPVQEALLVLGEQRTRLDLKQGRLIGRLVVRESAPLDIQIRSDNQWYRDATERQVIARADRAPLVEIQSPVDGSWIKADEATPIRFRAQDDEGLAELSLVLRLPDRTIVRRRLWSTTGAAAPMSFEEEVELLAADFGIRAGDRFELWLEARDGDAVSGPNQGESQHLTLEALSHAQHLSQHLPNLKRVLDLSVDSLAERLETPVSREAASTRRRHATLLRLEDAWLSALEALGEAIDGDGGGSLGLDPDQLAALARQYRRLRAQEQQLHRRQLGTLAARSRADKKLVEEAEKGVLLLADLLSQAHLDEANALSNELGELKVRIQELLREFSESDNAEAKRTLLAEIARAERRLQELMRSMASLAAHVPSEFVNHDALAQQSASETMGELREAVQEGDLDAAAAHLEELEQRLAALSTGLESGELQFRKARFGPRDEAMMKARERLQILGDEQHALAQQSAAQAREIMQRSGEDQAPRRTDDLQRSARQLLDDLDALGQRPMSMGERRGHEQAKARLSDAQAALETGDLSEAGRMGAAGQRAMERLARSLEDDAQMFQGHDGLAGEHAEQARKLSERMNTLQDAIAQRTPRLDRQMNAEDGRALDAMKGRQRQTRQAAQELERSLEQGPDGMPLSPEGANAVREAAQAMRDAEDSLDEGELKDANAAQQQAADQLQKLSEELAQKPSGQGSGQGRGGQRGDGGGQGDPGGRVRIPDGEDFEAPVARRRRILDAMREGRPPGYAGAVDAYYRELLR